MARVTLFSNFSLSSPFIRSVVQSFSLCVFFECFKCPCTLYTLLMPFLIHYTLAVERDPLSIVAMDFGSNGAFNEFKWFHCERQSTNMYRWTSQGNTWIIMTNMHSIFAMAWLSWMTDMLLKKWRNQEGVASCQSFVAFKEFSDAWLRFVLRITYWKYAINYGLWTMDFTYAFQFDVSIWSYVLIFLMF